MACDNCGHDDFVYPPWKRKKPKNVLMFICHECKKGLAGQEIIHVTEVIKRPLIRGRFVMPIAIMLWSLTIALALIVRF